MQGIFKLKNDYVEIYYNYSCFVTTMSEKSAGISKFPFSFEYFFVMNFKEPQKSFREKERLFLTK